MSEVTLERIAKGIQKAHANGNTEQVKKLGQAFRALQAKGPDQQTQQPKSTSYKDALLSGIDQAANNIGETLTSLGAEGAGQAFTDALETSENYDSATEDFMDGDGLGGFDWNALPRAAAEQVGQFAGAVATRAGGAAVGGLAAGPAGAVAGGFAGPATFEAMQVLGPVANERARNNGREKPNAQDWAGAAATAIGSGALNSLAPGVSGQIRRIATEGVTEAGQSVVQQTGETAATDKGLSVDAHQAVGEGILGGTAAGGFDGAVRGAQAVKNAPANVAQGIRYDSGFDDVDARLVERIERQADGDPKRINNVSDTESMSSAQGTAKGVQNGIRNDMKTRSSKLKKMAKLADDDYGLDLINRITGAGGNHKAGGTEADLREFEAKFGDTREGQEFADLARQIQRVEKFTASMGDLGGLGRYTRYIDFTDGRNAGITKVGAMFGAGGLGFSTGAIGLAAAGIGINRAARGIDNLTNKRSTVKRYVDSVKREKPQTNQLEGRPVSDILKEVKEQEAQAKIARQLRKKQSGNMLKKLKKGGVQKINQPGPKSALDQSKGEGLAEQFNLAGKNAEVLFEEGLGEIPQGVASFEPYRKWQLATGANPADTLDVLEQLAREGVVPQDTPQRFREDIRSFAKDKNTYDIQEAVRQRINPDYKNTEAFAAEKKRIKKVGDPDAALKRINEIDLPVKGNRGKEKALKGAARRRNLDADIRDAANLTPDQRDALNMLAEDIDSPNMTRADRFAKVRETLSEIFDTPIEQEVWRQAFSPLAAIGNDYRIEREAEKTPAEKEFDDRVEKAAKKSEKKSKKIESSVDEVTPTQLEFDLTPQQTPEDRALAKLNTPKKADPAPEPVTSTASKRQKAVEPALPKKTVGNKKGLEAMVQARIDKRQFAVNLANGEEAMLAAYINDLGKSDMDRVIGVILSSGNSQITQNMVAEAYAAQFGIPAVNAATIVDSVMKRMEEAGMIERRQNVGNTRLKVNGKYKTDADGNSLQVINFDIKEPVMAEMFKVAQAVNLRDRIVDPTTEPELQYEPGKTRNGVHQAFKAYDDTEADWTFKPAYEALNELRNSRLKINNKMLTQIEDGLTGSGKDQIGEIRRQLVPEVGTVLTQIKKGKNKGEWREKTLTDDSPMNTVAQLIFTHGDKSNRSDTTFRQEWFADKNIRLYPKNGLAHTQAGDLMKGLVRTPEAHALGGPAGLEHLLHSIGNLLGADKAAPKDRREVVMQKGVAKKLISFAENPFAQSKLRRNGKLTKLGELVEGGEGFFQVLNAAHEVKSMVEFAQERFPDKDMEPGALLSDPEVQADLAENYRTDYVAQFDASNNAYQLMGLTTGDQSILEATGMQPQQGINPDEVKGNDIYLDPAREIAQRIPELAELNLPEGKLRKLFKGPIGTLLYETEFNSRKEAFRKELENIAGKAPVFKIEGQGDGLITTPKGIEKAMMSDEGHTFEAASYNNEGMEKGTKRVRKRVKKLKDGRFQVETASGTSGKWKPAAKFKDSESAIKEVYSSQMYARMSSELLRDMNVRYPMIREYLAFAKAVTKITKDQNIDHVKIPSPDGMLLKSRFKDDHEYAKAEVELNGRVIPLGVKTEEAKLSGRGVAAAMMHQLDAYVLRETMKRMKAKGLGGKGFNPIHDSYGWHPSESEAGREIWAEVMQELGNEDFNIFTQIMEANGISMAQLRDANGVIPNRRGIQPVPMRQIPTALS